MRRVGKGKWFEGEGRNVMKNGSHVEDGKKD
jgi:hypothetical protein